MSDVSRAAIGKRLDQVSNRLDQVSDRLDQVSNRLDQVATQVGQLFEFLEQFSAITYANFESILGRLERSGR